MDGRTPPDDAEGLCERLIQVVLDAGREVDVNAIRAIAAEVFPVLERQRAEIERLRAAKRHLSERISVGQEGWNELHGEVERLRAELGRWKVRAEAWYESL